MGHHGGTMRNLALISAAVMLAAASLAAASLPLHAGTQQGTSGPAHRLNATMLAKQYKCGGEELQCGGNLAKVCNPKNGKCCCLTVGTYH